MSIYFRVNSFYSFNSIKAKARVASLVVFRLSYILLIESMRILSNLKVSKISYLSDKPFVIAKSLIPLTIIKAPMAHKKWSKEQITIRYFLYASSLLLKSIYYFSHEYVTLIYLLVKKYNFLPETPSTNLRALILSINIKKSLSI